MDDFDIFTSERYLDGDCDHNCSVAPVIAALKSPARPDELRGEVVVLSAFRLAHASRFSGFMRLASAKVSIAAAVVAFVFTGAVAASLNGVVPKPLHDAASTALSKTAVVEEEPVVSANSRGETATVVTWIEPEIGSIRYLVTSSRIEILEVSGAPEVVTAVGSDMGLSVDVRFEGAQGPYQWSASMTNAGVDVAAGFINQ